MKGKLIVIEGIDGAGKETQTDRLCKRLQNAGKDVKKASFPSYGSVSASLVEAYLNGAFGTAEEVTARQASLFFAIDRFGARKDIHSWLNEGKIVLCDRYTTANKGHQMGKLPKEEWSDFLDWISETEHGILDVPKEDHVIFLDLSVETSERLTLSRGGKKDVHEEDATHLQNAKQAFAFTASKEGWHTVVCEDAGQLRTIQDIHEEICSLPFIAKLLP